MSVTHGRAVVSLFGPARTAAGDAKLRDMICSPLDDCARIDSRASMIEYFAQHGTEFPFEGEWFDTALAYISDEDSRQRSSLTTGSGLRGWLARLMNADTGYAAVLSGARSMARIARASRTFLDSVSSDVTGLKAALPDMRKASEELCALFPEGEKWSFSKLVAIDAALHGPLGQRALSLLDFLGTTDACISVAQASRKLGFHRAEVLEDGSNTLEINGLRHPLLEKGVPNDISLGGEDIAQGRNLHRHQPAGRYQPGLQSLLFRGQAAQASGHAGGFRAQDACHLRRTFPRHQCQGRL